MDTILLSQAIEGYSLAAYARRLSKRTMADCSDTFRKLQSHLGTDPPIAEITAAEAGIVDLNIPVIFRHRAPPMC